MARRQPQLSLEELLHFRWLIGGGLALLAVWTLFYLERSMWIAAIAATLTILAALVFPQLPGRVPPFLWRLGFPGITLIFVLDLWMGDMIPAFVRLNLMLVVFRAVSHRTRREDLQLLVLCLFLIVVTGVLTVSLAFAAQILLFTGLAMAFLFIVNLIEDASGGEPVPAEQWTRISRRRLAARLWQACDLRLATLAFGLFVTVLGISTLIFLSFPRFEMENALSFLALDHSHKVTGFSEEIALSDVTEIARDPEIAMRVDVRGAGAVPPVPYWRMLALDEYDRGHFRVSRAAQRRRDLRYYPTLDLMPPAALAPYVREEARAAEEPRFVVFMEGGVSRYLPLPGLFRAVRFREMQDVRVNPFLHVFSMKRESAVLLSYRIEGADFSGVIPDPTFDEVRAETPQDARDSVDELSYPDTTRALPLSAADRSYLRSVVERITGGQEMTPEEFARRACAYLAEHHRYSMSVTLPASDRPEDPVIRWLGSSLPGYCEYFAAAFTLLSRAAGYPTRAVVGFKGGTWNAYENYYMVRNSDAHAWCEVYDGRQAWFRVDPTPGGGGVARTPEAVAVGMLRSDRSVPAYFDSLRMVWYRRIVNFDERSQQQVVGSIRGMGDTVMLWVNATVDTVWGGFRDWMRSPWTFRNKGDLLFVAIFAFFLSVVMKRCGIGTTDVLEWFRRGENPTRRRAGDLLRRLQRRMAHPPKGEWNRELAVQLAAELTVIRFGRPEDWSDPLRIFRAARRML